MKRTRGTNDGPRKRTKGYRNNQSQVRRIIKTLAEQKRENLNVTDQTVNHDAGSGTIVGGFARKNEASGVNWLATIQGTNGKKNEREGDSIFSQFVDYRLQLQGYSDYPSQRCRIIIYSDRQAGNTAASSNISGIFVTDGTDNGSGNLLIQPVDTLRYKVYRDFVVYPLKNQTMGGTANSNGLYKAYESMAKSYNDMQFDYFKCKNTLNAAAVTYPPLAPAAAAAEADYVIEAAKAYDEQTTFLEFDPDDFIDPDDTGNDCNYPIIKGRIKTNRKIQYLTGSQNPVKVTDAIQLAIIPYSDHNCTTQTSILKYSQELVHYFKDF